MRVLALGLLIWATQSFADVCENHFARKNQESVDSTWKPWSSDYFVSETIPSEEGFSTPGSRNLIVILTAHKARSELAPDELEVLTFFQHEYNVFMGQKATLERALRKSSVESCRRALANNAFEYETFLALAQRLSQDTIGRSFVEGESILPLINEVSPKLRLTWEVVQGRTDAELYFVLSDPTVRHVLFLGHGDDDGQLRDYTGNPVSVQTMTALGPNVESLGFLSCHSSDAMNLYGIREHFLALPGNGRNRRIFYVTPQTSFINWFGFFLRLVDKNLV